MQDQNHVIEAHELAKDGIVNKIYPLEGNEVMGLNMLEHPERRKRKRGLPWNPDDIRAGPFAAAAAWAHFWFGSDLCAG